MQTTAVLGCYLNHRSDPPPGPTFICRNYTQLATLNGRRPYRRRCETTAIYGHLDDGALQDAAVIVRPMTGPNRRCR